MALAPGGDHQQHHRLTLGAHLSARHRLQQGSRHIARAVPGYRRQLYRVDEQDRATGEVSCVNGSAATERGKAETDKRVIVAHLNRFANQGIQRLFASGERVRQAEECGRLELAGTSTRQQIDALVIEGLSQISVPENTYTSECCTAGREDSQGDFVLARFCRNISCLDENMDIRVWIG